MNDPNITISIRAAVSDDYAVLVPIADEVHALHAAAYPGIFQPVASSNSLPRSWFDDLLSGDTSTMKVAEVEGAVAGFVIASVFDAPPFEAVVPRRILFIESMVVTEAQRGKGIGRALLEAVKSWGQSRGATTLELTVWEANRNAMAFYERLGLATVNRTMQLELDRNDASKPNTIHNATR